MSEDLHRSSSLSELLDLHGQVALVTGAGQGVGATTASFLAQQGAAVAVNDYYLDRAERVVTELREFGATACAVQADITQFGAVTDMVAAIADTLGPVSILVNNAGNAGAKAASRKPFWETDPDAWEPFLAVNLDAVLNCCRAVAPGMIEAGYGRLVTIISDAGRVGEAGMEAYSAAKAGAAGLMRALARSMAQFGVTSNSIAIGFTNTPTMARVLEDDGLTERVLSRYLVRRVGEPTDVAALVSYLVSEAGSWITGQTYPVNGGFSVNQ